MSIITGTITSEMNVLKCRILTIKNISLTGQTLIIRAKESGETMQRSCPTTECCRANQIHYSCDVKPLIICTMQLNVNY